MKWEVTGADRETGMGRSVIVSAPDEESATRKGNQFGILVEKTRRIVAADPGETAKKPPGVGISAGDPGSSGQTKDQPDDEGIPNYSYILIGDQLLQFFATLLRAVGFVGFLVAALFFAFALYQLPSSSILHHEDFSVAMAGFAFALASAVPCFVVAVLLRMIGTVSLAVRDIARNSFAKD